MKIAQICFRFGAPGGVEHQVLQLSKELIKRGHEVVVFTSDVFSEVPWKKTHISDEVVDGIKTIRLKAYKNILPFLKSPIIPDMFSKLLECDADIYHAHSHRYFHLPIVSVAHQITDIPFIVTLHYHPPEAREGLKKKFMLKLGDFIFKNEVYKHCQRIITKTNLEKSYIRNFVPVEKCIAIPDGISQDWLTEPKENFRKTYGIDKPFVLYAGRLAYNKGLQYLVEASSIILKKHDIKFVFIGEEWGEKEKLIRQAEKLNIRDSIIFTGYIDNFEIYKSAFCECEIFALPSEWEAFGIVLLEAMACGKPCVATNVGGVPEVVDNGVNGFIVPYGNAEMLASKLCMLLENEKLRTEFGSNGRKKVLASYTWDKIVDALETVYEGVLEKHKNKGE